MGLTNNWLELTRRTKAYRVKVRMGWRLWLPEVQDAIAPNDIWQFINDYWSEFVQIVKIKHKINLDQANANELGEFFYKTGLIFVERKDGYKLSKNQLAYIAVIIKHYAPQILGWLKQGDSYAVDSIY